MNATVLKTVGRGDSARGFESHPLRQQRGDRLSLAPFVVAHTDDGELKTRFVLGFEHS